METFLTCPPDHYEVAYAINPYMAANIGTVNKVAARSQWEGLVQRLLALGAIVETISPEVGCPDMVFMSDPGLVVDNVFLAGRFATPERARESENAKAWMQERGYDVRQLPEGFLWEGNGELLCGLTDEGCANGVLFGGYGIRSEAAAYEWVAAELEFEVVKVKLTDPRFYHLDTCLTVLPGDHFLVYPDAMDCIGLEAIRERAPEGNLYVASAEDVACFALNAVVVGRDLVMNSVTSPLDRWLRDRGFRPHVTPVPEFIKAGGSTKCMTLKFHRLPPSN